MVSRFFPFVVVPVAGQSATVTAVKVRSTDAATELANQKHWCGQQ